MQSHTNTKNVFTRDRGFKLNIYFSKLLSGLQVELASKLNTLCTKLEFCQCTLYKSPNLNFLILINSFSSQFAKFDARQIFLLYDMQLCNKFYI